jgi:hypothetical protein
MTTDDELPAVIDVDPSFAEDGKSLYVWQTHADGTLTLWTHQLGAGIGQDQTPHIVA